MAAKLAANWQRREEADYGVRANTLIALMAGTLSLGIGVLGGLIARCALNH
jgi:ABC-type dipeptide/oligopeptide/nickel transport system permease subunit